jgi:hypothetical protein
MISYEPVPDTGVNSFSADLLKTSYFKKLILDGIADSTLQLSLLWISSMPLEHMGLELTVELWKKIFGRARNLGITMTPEQKTEFLEVVVKYNLQASLSWIK